MHKSFSFHSNDSGSAQSLDLVGGLDDDPGDESDVRPFVPSDSDDEPSPEKIKDNFRLVSLYGVGIKRVAALRGKKKRLQKRDLQRSLENKNRLIVSAQDKVLSCLKQQDDTIRVLDKAVHLSILTLGELQLTLQKEVQLRLSLDELQAFVEHYHCESLGELVEMNPCYMKVNFQKVINSIRKIFEDHRKQQRLERQLNKEHIFAIRLERNKAQAGGASQPKISQEVAKASLSKLSLAAKELFRSKSRYFGHLCNSAIHGTMDAMIIREFCKHNLDLKLSSEEAAAILQYSDKYGKGTISYQYFLKQLKLLGLSRYCDLDINRFLRGDDSGDPSQVNSDEDDEDHRNKSHSSTATFQSPIKQEQSASKAALPQVKRAVRFNFLNTDSDGAESVFTARNENPLSPSNSKVVHLLEGLFSAKGQSASSLMSPSMHRIKLKHTEYQLPTIGPVASPKDLRQHPIQARFNYEALTIPDPDYSARGAKFNIPSPFEASKSETSSNSEGSGSPKAKSSSPMCIVPTSLAHASRIVPKGTCSILRAKTPVKLTRSVVKNENKAFHDIQKLYYGEPTKDSSNLSYKNKKLKYELRWPILRRIIFALKSREITPSNILEQMKKAGGKFVETHGDFKDKGVMFITRDGFVSTLQWVTSDISAQHVNALFSSLDTERTGLVSAYRLSALFGFVYELPTVYNEVNGIIFSIQGVNIGQQLLRFALKELPFDQLSRREISEIFELLCTSLEAENSLAVLLEGFFDKIVPNTIHSFDRTDDATPEGQLRISVHSVKCVDSDILIEYLYESMLLNKFLHDQCLEILNRMEQGESSGATVPRARGK